MPNITVANIISIVKDYCRNQNLSDDRVIRAINQAIDFLSVSVGFPNHEKEYDFYFDETSTSYDLPDDFTEALFLRFDDDNLNGQDFSYKPIEQIWSYIPNVSKTTKLFSVRNDEGFKIVVLGKNKLPSYEIDDFDYNNSTNWTASNDATNIQDDTIVYTHGSTSMKFSIVPALSGLNRATVTRVLSNIDLTDFSETGKFKCDAYLENITNLTSISFAFGADTSNYWKSTQTTQEDGTAFVVGWNHMSFDIDSATIVGSPDISSLATCWYDYDYTAAFTGGTNFRLDYLRVTSPDLMHLTYISNIKGTTSTGTALYDFTATTDILGLSTYDIGLRNLVAIYTAAIINPQILIEDTQVKEQYKMYLSMYSRRYPRKRINNLLVTPKKSKTSF